jgi:3-hydroxyisobutyrate dehydrogenase-like beta-hydroxyacid dehydrogenase
MPETLGFIGLGNMGAAIAANLLKAGYGLRVYNRTAAKAAPLVDKGATLASKPAEVAQSGGIVLTMVADDRALEDLSLTSGSFVERLGSGGIHISMSTIAPATAERLAEHHAKFGVTYLASPVFGRPEAAAAAKLWICVSGATAAKEKAKPIHAAIGQGVFDFGEGVASANVVKLCGNFLIASAIESLAESLTLAEKNGVDKKAVADMLGKTILACPVYQGYSKQIAEERFEPAGFRLALGLKDITLALQAATAKSMPMPVGSLLRDRWLASVAKGRENLDWTAIALSVAEDAGLKNEGTKNESVRTASRSAD